MSIHSHRLSLPALFTRASASSQTFDPQLIEAMARAYRGACRTLGLSMRNDAFNEMVARHLIELAQSGVRTSTALYMLTVMEFKSNPQ